MTKKAKSIPIFIVIYPYKFNDFLYDLMEIEYYKPYCEVAIWDVSLIVDKKFAEGISSARSSKKEIVLVKSVKQFFSLLIVLRKESRLRNICVFNEMAIENISSTLYNFMIKIMIKGTGAAILDAYNGGVQILAVETVSGGREKTLMRKLSAYIKGTNSLPETIKLLKTIFCQMIARIFGILPTTHRLVAGNEWIEVAKRHGTQKKGIKFIYGSSNDFSNSLLNNVENSDVAEKKEKMALLLDGAGPAFGGDHIHLRRMPVLTSDVWYPSLTTFLDRVEAETGAVVEIAGHYKSVHPHIAPCFGNRKVYYGMTKELVRNCDFVITRMSAAVSYAIIFKKPVIYIYSDQLKNDLNAIGNIKMMAAALGNKPVNIDDQTINILPLLIVNEDKYSEYKRACLTSAENVRPNVQIILEEVMGVKVNPNLFNKGANDNFQ